MQAMVSSNGGASIPAIITAGRAHERSTFDTSGIPEGQCPEWVTITQQNGHVVECYSPTNECYTPTGWAIRSAMSTVAAGSGYMIGGGLMASGASIGVIALTRDLPVTFRAVLLSSAILCLSAGTTFFL